MLTWDWRHASVTRSYLFPTTIKLKSRWLKLSKIWSRIVRQYWKHTIQTFWAQFWIIIQQTQTHFNLFSSICHYCVRISQSVQCKRFCSSNFHSVVQKCKYAHGSVYTVDESFGCVQFLWFSKIQAFSCGNHLFLWLRIHRLQIRWVFLESHQRIAWAQK